MKPPKTQRALACYDTTGGFEWIDTTPPQGYEAERYTPVLVVPEAAVKRCDHVARGVRRNVWGEWTKCEAWCPDCGAYAQEGGRWQRPRLLRVQP